MNVSTCLLMISSYWGVKFYFWFPPFRSMISCFRSATYFLSLAIIRAGSVLSFLETVFLTKETLLANRHVDIDSSIPIWLNLDEVYLYL